VKLEEGEVFCNKCKGEGVIPLDEKRYLNGSWYSCSRCRGTGKMDWISNITRSYKMIFDIWFPTNVFNEMISNAMKRRFSESVSKARRTT
jgi:excinuclease UvrABC ATPase subunit